MAKKKDKKAEGTPVKPYGVMYPSVEDGGPMFLRLTVGTASSPEGTTYELTLHAGRSFPIIMSSKTGKRFMLTWQDVVDMARAGGIDQ